MKIAVFWTLFILCAAVSADYLTTTTATTTEPVVDHYPTIEEYRDINERVEKMRVNVEDLPRGIFSFKQCPIFRCDTNYNGIECMNHPSTRGYDRASFVIGVNEGTLGIYRNEMRLKDLNHLLDCLSMQSSVIEETKERGQTRGE